MSEVPEDLRVLYEHASFPMMVGADSAWRSECKTLIERIAALTERVAELEAQLVEAPKELQQPCYCCSESADSVDGYCQNGCACKPPLLAERASSTK